MNEPTAEELANQPFLLRAIYLRESHTKLDDEFDPLKAGQRLNGQFSSSAEHYSVTYESDSEDAPAIARACTFSTKFEFVIRLVEEGGQSPNPDPASAKVAATITACMAVDYLLKPGAKEPTPEFLERYGRSAAVVHKWPYWREFCHSTMLRMHLPLMMVPLLAPPGLQTTPSKKNSKAKSKTKTKSKTKI